jgi:hypothetical protein
MQLLRVFHAKRVVVCLGLLGSLALASGCGESNPATSVSDDEAKAKTQAQRDALKNAYGPGGPTGARPKK